MVFGGMLLISVFSSGCGPVYSLSNIIEARAAIDALDNVKGWYWNCYEYYAAIHYLKKSREERGYSDFQASGDFASKSAKLAQNGRKMTLLQYMRKKVPPVICDKPEKMKKKYGPIFKKELKRQIEILKKLKK